MVESTRDIVIGVFDHRDKAEVAVSELQAAGFSSADIGVAARNDEGEWNDHETVAPAVTAAESDTAAKTVGGAVAGAATGAGVAGLWALGIAVGMVPAIGPVIAGGLLANVLASAAVGAAAGGLLGALVGLGFSDEEARYYETEFRSGRTIVTVRTRGRYDAAVRILRSHGAFDMSNQPAAIASR